MIDRDSLELAKGGGTLVFELGVEQIAAADGGDVEACVRDHPSVCVFFLLLFDIDSVLGCVGMRWSGLMVDHARDVDVIFVTRCEYVVRRRYPAQYCNDMSSDRSIRREIEGNASSEGKENGFTYRTTRGNRPRYRDLYRLSVHLLTQSTFSQDSNLPKATERSRTRPLRSICMVHTSVSLIPDSVVVDCRARNMLRIVRKVVDSIGRNVHR